MQFLLYHCSATSCFSITWVDESFLFMCLCAHSFTICTSGFVIDVYNSSQISGGLISLFCLLFMTSHFDLFLSMVTGMETSLDFYSSLTQSNLAKRIRFLLQCSLYRGSS
jgi:hypothetical protein